VSCKFVLLLIQAIFWDIGLLLVMILRACPCVPVAFIVDRIVAVKLLSLWL